MNARRTSISAVPIRFTAHEEDDVDVVVAEVTNEKPDAPRYEEANFSVNRQREPHETPLPEMIKHVVRVVSVEGPVHELEIVVRIRSLWGLARAGNRIRDAVLAAVKAAKRNGDIVGGPFYSLPGQEVVLRNRSEIELQHAAQARVSATGGSQGSDRSGRGGELRRRAGPTRPGRRSLVWFRLHQRAIARSRGKRANGPSRFQSTATGGSFDNARPIRNCPILRLRIRRKGRICDSIRWWTFCLPVNEPSVDRHSNRVPQCASAAANLLSAAPVMRGSISRL